MLENGTSQSPKHVAKPIHLGCPPVQSGQGPHKTLGFLLFNLQPSGVEKSFLPLGWKSTMT